MSAKRDRLQVIQDILTTVSNKRTAMKPTHIQYKANLSSKMLKEYLAELTKQELLVENKEGRGRTYLLSDKGWEYINKFKMISEFIDTFSLDGN